MNATTFVVRMIGALLTGVGMGLVIADLVGPLPDKLHFSILTVLLISILVLLNVKIKDS